MPAEVSHCFYADQFYQRFVSELNYNDFVLGNLLPDIRYLGFIEREKTHKRISESDLSIGIKSLLNKLDFTEVLSPHATDSFSLGFAAHSIIDFLWNRKIGNIISKKEKIREGKIIQLASDLALYDLFIDWPKVVIIIRGQSKFSFLKSVSDKDIKKWYLLLADCFEFSDNRSYKRFARAIKIPSQYAEEILTKAQFLKERYNQLLRQDIFANLNS